MNQIRKENIMLISIYIMCVYIYHYDEYNY